MIHSFFPVYEETRVVERGFVPVKPQTITTFRHVFLGGGKSLQEEIAELHNQSLEMGQICIA